MEHLEVMPISTRVVSLNAPYLKTLCLFEALSQTLGCCYNHLRPQVVSCNTSVRLPASRMVKVRGHVSHTHAPCDTPTIQTTIQMGTYLLFYLKDWKEIHKCQLVINGLEKVSKGKAPVPPKVLLERVLDAGNHPTHIDQDNSLTNGTTKPIQELIQGNNTQIVNNIHDNSTAEEVIFSGKTPSISEITQRLFSNARASDKTFNANTLPKQKRLIRKQTLEDKNFNSPAQLTTNNLAQNGTTNSINNYSQKPQEERIRAKEDNNRAKINSKINRNYIIINMDKSEEVTTLLDDDDDNDDSEYTSDTSEDIHKVVRKRLSVDITPLLQPSPKDNILILLLRPAEETQAWQFLSTCMKVTHYSSNALVTEGKGTIKKALTRTRPLYFSKSGNAHRL